MRVGVRVPPGSTVKGRVPWSRLRQKGGEGKPRGSRTALSSPGPPCLGRPVVGGEGRGEGLFRGGETGPGFGGGFGAYFGAPLSVGEGG